MSRFGIVAGEGKKSEIFGGPEEGGPAEGGPGKGLGKGGRVLLVRAVSSGGQCLGEGMSWVFVGEGSG